MKTLALIAFGTLVAGCAASNTEAQPEGRYAAGHFRASAELHDASGAKAGTATAQEVKGGIKVTVNVEGATPGVHGIHVHTTGKCEAPGFTTAGGHWNPGMKQHGMDNPMGMHAGDLPNITVGADGKGSESFTITGGTFEGLMDQDGAAIVLHAGPDDLKSDPAGNSGGRVACGVFAAD